MSNLGENIKKIRKKHKLTQVEFSDLIGISRSYLGDLENNRKSPSMETIQKLADKLDVSVGYLVGGKSTEYLNQLMDYIALYTKNNNLPFDEANALFVSQKYASTHKKTDSNGMLVPIDSPPDSFDDINLNQVIEDYLHFAGNYTEEEKRIMKEISIGELRKKRENESLNEIEKQLLDKLELEESKEKSVDGVRDATQKDIDFFMG